MHWLDYACRIKSRDCCIERDDPRERRLEANVGQLAAHSATVSTATYRIVYRLSFICQLANVCLSRDVWDVISARCRTPISGKSVNCMKSFDLVFCLSFQNVCHVEYRGKATIKNKNAHS